MLTVTVRFYITAGGLLAALILLMRISFLVGSFKRAFDDHVKQSDQRFQEVDADVRELRARRR